MTQQNYRNKISTSQPQRTTVPGLITCWTDWLQTGSSPIFPLRSHSLVHSKNNSYFVGIQTLLEKELIKLFVWRYLFSACYFRRDKILLDTYVIHNRSKFIIYFIFVSVTMDFCSNYISQSFQFFVCTTKRCLSCFGCCCTNCCNGWG